MRVAPDCRPPPTARHKSQPRRSTSHPPPATRRSPHGTEPLHGEGAIAGAGPCAATTHGLLRAAPGPGVLKIGVVHKEKGDLKTALFHYQKAIEVWRRPK
jgi:hypothetical protein